MPEVDAVPALTVLAVGTWDYPQEHIPAHCVNFMLLAVYIPNEGYATRTARHMAL